MIERGGFVVVVAVGWRDRNIVCESEAEGSGGPQSNHFLVLSYSEAKM